MMQLDFSWEKSVQQYIDLYQSMWWEGIGNWSW